MVTQHAVQKVQGNLFPGVKWPVGEVGHSPPAADEVTIAGDLIALSCILPYGMMINHKENFTAYNS
jgi:hypothetical protein